MRTGLYRELLTNSRLDESRQKNFSGKAWSCHQAVRHTPLVGQAPFLLTQESQKSLRFHQIHRVRGAEGHKPLIVPYFNYTTKGLIYG